MFASTSTGSLSKFGTHSQRRFHEIFNTVVHFVERLKWGCILFSFVQA